METKPVILLSYSNDENNPVRFLKKLEEEKNLLEKIFGRYAKTNDVHIHSIHSSTSKNLIDNLNLFKDRLLIFHFSGHANGTLLELESGDLAKENLSRILAGEKRLKLVFLNACKTLDHVKILHELGIAAVIATSVSVADKQAKDFAETFYEASTAGSTLKEAFNRAQTVIESDKSIDRIYTRDAVRKMTIIDGKFQPLKDWGLYVQDDSILTWKLADDVPQRPEFPHELNFAPPVHADTNPPGLIALYLPSAIVCLFLDLETLTLFRSQS